VDARDPDPPQRLQRALVLTCAAVVVGVAAHLLGGGTVEPVAVAAAFPVLLGLSWPLTHRERGWLPIAGAQLAGQQVVHTLLSSATDVAAPGPPVDASCTATCSRPCWWPCACAGVSNGCGPSHGAPPTPSPCCGDAYSTC